MNRRGFTLIEVLAGLAILAIFITLVQGVYSGVAKNKRASEELTEAAHGAAAVLGKMADELSMAFQSRERKSQTIFLLSTDMVDNSKVEFTTTTARVEKMSAGGETRVRYEVRADPSDNELYQIVRISLADPFGDLERDGDEVAMLGNIKRFTISCYDGAEWVSMWDGGGDLENPKLPQAVKLTMVWVDRSKNQRTLSTATPIWSSGGLNAKSTTGGAQ